MISPNPSNTPPHNSQQVNPIISRSISNSCISRAHLPTHTQRLSCGRTYRVPTCIQITNTSRTESVLATWAVLAHTTTWLAVTPNSSNKTPPHFPKTASESSRCKHPSGAYTTPFNIRVTYTTYKTPLGRPNIGTPLADSETRPAVTLSLCLSSVLRLCHA